MAALNRTTGTPLEEDPAGEAAESSGSDGEAEVLGRGGKVLRVLSREAVKGMSARDIRLRERELQVCVSVSVSVSVWERGCGDVCLR